MTPSHIAARWLIVGGAALIGLFQIALAAGAPWGGWAYGGGHVGILPGGLRVASVGAALAWAAIALATARMQLPVTARARLWLALLAAVGLVGAVMNGISPSIGERVLWAPVSLAIGVCALWLRRSKDPR